MRQETREKQEWRARRVQPFGRPCGAPSGLDAGRTFCERQQQAKSTTEKQPFQTPDHNLTLTKSGPTIGVHLSRHGKRFHFHFGLTSDNLTSTSPEIVCGYLVRQWRKIGKSVCEVVPWDSSKTPLGIWYLTQNNETPLHHSRYFHGEYCHWKMSTLLHTSILKIANQRGTP